MPYARNRIVIQEDELYISSKLAANRVKERVGRVVDILDHITRVHAQSARLADIPVNTLRRGIQRASSKRGSISEESLITIDIERPESSSFRFEHEPQTEQDLVHNYGLTAQHVDHMSREIDHLELGTSRWLAYFRARGCRTMPTDKMLGTLREELRALKTYHATLRMVQYRVHGRLDIVAQDPALRRARGRAGNDLRTLLEEAAELTMPDCHPLFTSSSEGSMVGVSAMASSSEESLISVATTESISEISLPSLCGASSVSDNSFVGAVARVEADTVDRMRPNGAVHVQGNKRVKIARRH